MLQTIDYGLSLGQVACAEESNEITAIPELLRLVGIRGAIITIDAMGARKAIAEQIIEGEADYALALKGNQETPHQAVIDHIDERLEGDLAGAQERVTAETGHGREETRTYLQLPAPEGLPGSGLWRGLKSLGLVTTCCLRDGTEAVEVRYYVSSLEVDVERLARAVRGRWGIENGCHWVLDMTFREDESRTREKHLRENFGWLNRFALSLLKQHPGGQSVVMKRRSHGWSDAFLMEVLPDHHVSVRWPWLHWGRGDETPVSGAVSGATRMATVKRTDAGKSMFLKEYLADYPDAGMGPIEAAWREAGNAGTISTSLVSKVRKDLGLTGKGAARKSRARVGTGARSARAAKSAAGRTAAPPDGGPVAEDPGRAAEGGDRAGVLLRLEGAIDGLLHEIRTAGGLPEFEEALRRARRILARSHAE